MSPPFGKAPDWWARNYSVIPLEPNTKRPVHWLKQWPSYCTTLPSMATREQWHGSSAHCGIGLCLGTEIVPGFRIIGIDVDQDRLVRVTTNILGGNVSAKRGAKGLTLFALLKAESKIKSTSINDHKKRGGIDLLSIGKMTVLPPSIHPKTGQPYTWVSASLLDINFRDLPVFDEHKLALLRLVVGSEHKGPPHMIQDCGSLGSWWRLDAMTLTS